MLMVENRSLASTLVKCLLRHCEGHARVGLITRVVNSGSAALPLL